MKHRYEGLLVLNLKGKEDSAQKVIERIEKDSGKSVVTNTQAWTWEALHGMGMREPITGFGRLLRHQ